MQHVVVVPYPAQGHINPMLQLCHQLVPLGFTFTFVNTHHIHRRVQRSRCADYPTENNYHVPHQDAHVHAAKPVNGASTDPVNDIAQAEDIAHANGVAPRDNGGQMMRHIHSQQGLKEYEPIRMVFVEGGCAPEQFSRLSTSKEAFLAARAMEEQVEQFISNVMEEQPVAFLLTDILLGWGNATAGKFGLPWVCFCPASAATCSMLAHLGDIANQGKLMPLAGKQDGEVPVIDSIPGLPPTSLDDMPKFWDNTTGKLYHAEFLKYIFSAVEQASFLLLNTFSELEGQVVIALSKRCPNILALGPLLPSRFMLGHEASACTCPDNTRQDGLVSSCNYRPSLFREDRTCLDWLDKQAPFSVLFISFGSVSARTEEQLQELAEGVEASGCPFLWVRRLDNITAADSGNVSGRPGAAQQQIAAAAAGRGLIVPWAPQLEVLSHPAVGGFITHCGWNSVIESVAMGVPMLCWADTGERMSNQRFVVQVWKCGLDMVADRSRRYKQHIDEGAQLVRQEEIEKAIRWLMKEEGGAPVRARAAQLRDCAISAFLDSSRFDLFVHAMQPKRLHSKL